MILHNSDLPSRGLFIRDSKPIPIPPMTFSQLLRYTSTPEVDEIRQYRKDLMYLESSGIDLSSVSLLDADYLIFMMKAVTISENVIFNAEMVDKYKKTVRYEFGLSDISFLDYEEAKIPIQVNLGGTDYDIKVPTISKFVEVLDRVLSRNPEATLTTLRLMSLFTLVDRLPNQVEDAIQNASGPDAATLFYLDDICFGRLKPLIVQNSKGESELVNIDILQVTKGFFGDYLRRNRPDESKIKYK